MSRAPTDLPPRLLAGDASDFEQRLLGAALQKRPSDVASGRMAKALGVTVTGVGSAAVAARALAAEGAAAKATTAAGGSLVWPWVSVTVLGLVVAGAVIGGRLGRAPQREATAPRRAPVLVTPAPVQAVPPLVAARLDAARVPAAQRHHLRGTPTESDLREQIALVDQARAALSGGSAARALELLRRYQDRYPSGSFRPETTALAIEAFVKLGREAEARALATRFVAEHKGTLLAARVAELAGLAAPPPAAP